MFRCRWGSSVTVEFTTRLIEKNVIVWFCHCYLQNEHRLVFSKEEFQLRKDRNLQHSVNSFLKVPGPKEFVANGSLDTHSIGRHQGDFPRGKLNFLYDLEGLWDTHYPLDVGNNGG